MALPLDSATAAELRDEASSKAPEERASSCDRSSSSSSSSEAAMSPSREEDGAATAATPPPTQLMDRSDSGGADPDRIPAAVFERDATEPSKDWSMMSTESVFGLQVAPSGDFTGFFLAHPELMDISTPPRTSTVNVDADAPVLSPHFETIPELPEATMKGNYSFAFPNLIEDKRHSSKVVQDEQPPATTAATTEAAQVAPAPAEPEAETSSKPEALPETEEAKGGLFSCFPCCS